MSDEAVLERGDAALIAGAAGGDARAFEELVDRRSPSFFRCLRSLARREADAAGPADTTGITRKGRSNQGRARRPHHTGGPRVTILSTAARLDRARPHA